MDIRSVREYRSPSYPTQGILAEHPELLRLVPERWRRNRLVLTGLGLTCSLLLAGCPPPREKLGDASGSKAETSPLVDAPEDSSRLGAARIQPSQAAEKTKRSGGPDPLVAPVFEHGAGVDTPGLGVAVMPAFLTEEDARGIVISEARAAGLALSSDWVRPSQAPPKGTDGSQPSHCVGYSQDVAS